MKSLELETLDQLLGGELSLAVIRGLFTDSKHFVRALQGLLSSGEVQLVANHGVEVPKWRQRELFVNEPVTIESSDLKLRITEQGLRRIR